MEQALFELLKTAPGMRAKVGTRIYPLELPQGCRKPAIVYQRVSGTPDIDMEGATGLVESRFFIFFYGEKARGVSAYGQAKGIRDIVVSMLSRRPGFRDNIGTIEIQSAYVNDESDRRMEEATGKGVARVQLDCTFWHRETKGS